MTNEDGGMCCFIILVLVFNLTIGTLLFNTDMAMLFGVHPGAWGILGGAFLAQPALIVWVCGIIAHNSCGIPYPFWPLAHG